MKKPKAIEMKQYTCKHQFMTHGITHGIKVK